MREKLKSIVDRSNLSVKTYKIIKNLILSKEIKDKFSLDKLAERLGVSRTPVISALNKLEAEGFITNIPYKGYSVKKHSEKEVKEIFEIRVLFESLGAEKLIKNSTEKDTKQIRTFLEKFENYYRSKNTGKYRELDILFHKYIVKNTKNDSIIRLYNEQIIVPALLTTFLSLDESIQHHRELINSILQGNVARAKKIISKHIGALM